MKKISFVIAALAVVSLSSCYVEEREGHRYHHPFWHHRAVERVEIRGSNDIKQDHASQYPVRADAERR